MNVINEWEEMYQTGGLTPEVIVQHLRNIAGTFILPVGADQPQLPDQQQQEQQQQQQQQNVPDPDAQGGNNGFLSGNYVYSDTMARAATIAVMELFICGPNPDNYLEQIRQADTVSSVCGRVFKIGEPTYSCRECSMDPTCVLCSTCFKKSEHRNHKYKMATSGGGGCCDCGDEEAWKKYPFCEEHAVCITDQTQASQQQQAPLPEERKMRCEIVFRAILNYSMQMLQMHGTGNCPELEDDENTHCTILYNDETHTFEQVIQTLTSIVKCEHKTAIEYVTSIDREGRAVVKCASFEVCKKLKEDIENKAMRSTLTTRAMPLKVTVMHRNEVACQHLAMQLLVWLQEFLTKNSTFRSVFAETISKPQVTYNLKFILSNDHNLWKSARACWHRLLISGMLMEYENKKLLATTFTKLYTSLMQDFIRDDHYHSFSIVSLSVQLFTVPTIAHYLIENESAFFKLMHTYFSETIDKYVKNRQLVFIKNTSTMNSFKRAAYILIDLKYLLSFKPEKWTPELRVGFLHGMQQLIRLLKYMQGMDAATRQVGQHLEYEQEWETAFTLHLKLSHLITLVLEWCATDRMVLLKVLRMVITALTETKFIALESETVVCEAANHSASCLTYDVLTRPVSVHLPLTRFLAGLYTVFERHDFTFDKVSQNLPDRPTPEQIIEPVLCARTMMSQVQAGMWRRNGYALINQLFFYRNVKCRYEMLDRDIVILQMGASLIEANEFIIHVLNKYKLLGWLEQDVPERQRAVDAGSGSDEDHMRQAGILVEEFLELLIVIIGERYVPGVGDVTESDRIKKEIVQQLCIKPHSHSELSRALNEDSCSEIMFESVIDDVAVFEKPNSAEKRGVYILKPEYNSWYNLYFYHYSKEDKSRSEERQRLQKKEKNELVCCPPPTLPKLTQIFSTIPTLLQCDVMLKVMHVVMTRALDLRSVSFTEGQLQRVLHLIGYALQEEESGHYPYMTFYDRSQTIGLLPMLEELCNHPRVESLRDLLRWVIQRYKAMEAKRISSIQSEIDRGESSGSGLAMADLDRLEKEQRAKLAALRRAQLMAQMKQAQQTFMNTNPDMFSTESDDSSELGQTEPEQSGADMDWQTTSVQLVALGPNRTPVKPADTAALRHSCILCSEKSVLGTYDSVNMVYAAFVQRSSVLSRYQQTDERGQLQLIETKTHPSPHLTTCGHVMHTTCFDKYYNNEVIKENRRPYRNRAPILFDIEKNEFLCPLCRFLSNCLLPLVPPHETITSSAKARTNASVRAAGGPDSLPDPPITQPNEFTFPLWYAFMQDMVANTAHRVEHPMPPRGSSGGGTPKERAIRATQQDVLIKRFREAEQQPMSLEEEMPTASGGAGGGGAAAAGSAGADGGQQQPEPSQHRQLRDGSRVMMMGGVELPVYENEDDVLLDQYHSNQASLTSTDEEMDSDEDVRWVMDPPIHLNTLVLRDVEPLHGVRLRYYGTTHDPPEISRLFDRTIKYSLLNFAKNVRSFTTVPYKAKRFAEYLAPWLTLSYTIKSIEMQLRVMQRPLGSELSIRYSTCLTGLVRAASAMGPLVKSMTAHYYMLLFLVDVYETLFGLKPSPSFFEWDLFGLLNTCLFTTRSVLYSFVRTERMPKGDTLDHSIVQAIFVVNMLRTIITSVTGMETAQQDTPMADGADEGGECSYAKQREDPGKGPLTDAERNLLTLFQRYNIHQPKSGSVDADDGHDDQHLAEEKKKKQEGSSPQEPVVLRGTLAEQRRISRQLVHDIQLQSHTLLRCCCLLFHGVTDIELPQCTDVPELDYQPMMKYLDLPVDPLAYLRTGEPTYELVERLARCNADQIERMRYARQAQLLGEPKSLFQPALPVRQLIDLPDDYSDLINSVSLFTCPNNIRDDSRNPTMCLVCGEILCSQSFCCQKELDKSPVGSCTYHTAECGAGIGIFLRIRDAEILLLGINKGCFIPAPYLDEYGETDQGLRRGNPLRLCKERYHKLYMIWLTHGLHEEITRRNEAQQTIFATQWQNL
ncbi:E3 ubiquitin-protein ligase UBR1 [Anopheles merus]|uniref:E3 ubiquitin-protein ligase n=1 Tax=Anopheles merus TaxID=30066 RepID=A0A182VHA8_ANOME|nr:E3 ubiquitin-protein ligase UBR1 [Anopheles merus]XP_041778376.1 E3 ubiquitin-protein ligase UBR1 [Anopheles merus]